MAFTVTSRQNAKDFSFSTSTAWTSSSFTPSSNSLLVVAFGGQQNSPANDPTFTVSGGGLTWTRQARQLNSGVAFSAVGEIWTANVGGSPSSMTVTATMNTGSFNSGALVAISVFDVTGSNLSYPIGITKTNSQASYSTDFSESLGGTTASTSLVVALTQCDSVGSAVFTPASGWSAVYNTQASTYWGWICQYRSGALSQVDHTITGAPYAEGFAAIEIGGGLELTVTAGTITLTGQQTQMWQSGPNGAAFQSDSFQATAFQTTADAGSGGGSVTITVTAGGIALTGQSTTLKVGRQIGVTNGTVTLTGQSTTLKVGRQITTTAGQVTLTGQSTTVKADRQIAVTAGQVTLTGQSTTLSKGGLITVTAGQITLTGQSVALKVSRQVAVSAGTVTLGGQTVTMSKGVVVTVSAGTVTLTGQSVTLKAGRSVVVTAGQVTLSGQSVTLAVGRQVAVAAATVTLTGQSVTLKYGRSVVVTAGQVTLTGQSITLRVARQVAVSAGTVTLTGQSVTLTKATANSITVTAGQILLSGQDVTLTTSAVANDNYYRVGGSSVVEQFTSTRVSTDDRVHKRVA